MFEVLKNHYQYYHKVEENNCFFREIFSPDNKSKKYNKCQIKFKDFYFIEINRLEAPWTIKDR